LKSSNDQLDGRKENSTEDDARRESRDGLSVLYTIVGPKRCGFLQETTVPVQIIPAGAMERPR